MKRATQERERPTLRTAKLSDVRDFLNILYFGNEGSGKTTDLARMANLGRVLYVNAEGGVKKGPLKERGVNVDNIEIWPDPEGDETITLEGLEDVFWALKSDLVDDPDSWAGTVWDSGGEITRALLFELTTTRAEKAQHLMDTGKTVAEIMTNRFFTDQSEWGEMSEQVRFLVRRFRDLPCHFGIATLMRRDKDDDGKVVYGPSVNPALQGDLAGWVDIVCRTEAEDVDGEDFYRGYFRAMGKYRGKDRYSVIPRTLENPYVDKLVSYIQGKEEVPEETEVKKAQPVAKRRSVVPSRVAPSTAALRAAQSRKKVS